MQVNLDVTLTRDEEQQWLFDRERGGWQYAVERLLKKRTVETLELLADEWGSGLWAEHLETLAADEVMDRARATQDYLHAQASRF